LRGRRGLQGGKERLEERKRHEALRRRKKVVVAEKGFIERDIVERGERCRREKNFFWEGEI